MCVCVCVISFHMQFIQPWKDPVYLILIMIISLKKSLLFNFISNIFVILIYLWVLIINLSHFIIHLSIYLSIYLSI